MHELSLARRLVAAIQERLSVTEVKPIKFVRLRLGFDTGLSFESMKLALSAATIGTPVEGAEIIIEPATPRAICTDCGADVEQETDTLVCPACRVGMLIPAWGREVEVVEVGLLGEGS